MRAKALQRSALLVKGKTIVAARIALSIFRLRPQVGTMLGDEPEAELFKTIPTLEHVNELLRADDTHVVLTLRGQLLWRDNRSGRQRRTEIEAVLETVGGVVNVLLGPVLQFAAFLLVEGSDNFGGSAEDE